MIECKCRNFLRAVIALTICLMVLGVTESGFCTTGKSFWKKECTFTSVKGRPINLFSAGQGKQTILIIAGVHGDEPVAVGVVKKLMSHVAKAKRLKCRVLVMPTANPDGLAAGTRWNAHHIDLNRNMPSRDFKPSKPGRYSGGTKPLSEPESRAINTVLKKYHPSLVISVHTPFGEVLYCGNAKKVAKLISSLDGMPVKGSVGYGTPGALGEYCGNDLKIPIITLEIPWKGDQWKQQGKALMAVLGLKE